MKKILLFILVVILLVAGTYYFYPDIFFRSGLFQQAYLTLDGAETATFYFKEDQTSRDTVYMRGDIYKGTLEDIQTLFIDYPNLTTLVMEDVPGSIDDEANLLASREIRKHKINTYVPMGGMIASGGTDMFLAGVKRGVHPTASLGVHSWWMGQKKAIEYPKDDEVHKIYLDYYKEMNIPEEFYWFTLEIAPADEMHWMTAEELIKYQVIN